jgi:hypothetical protein
MLRIAAAVCVAVVVLVAVIVRGHAATGSGSSSRQFDVALFESYTVAHHHPRVPYRDAGGKLSPFAAAWMAHKQQCGGAMNDVALNPETFSLVQVWQGCYAVRKAGTTAIVFYPAPWIN